jgi:hypothetical protein
MPNQTKQTKQTKQTMDKLLSKIQCASNDLAKLTSQELAKVVVEHTKGPSGHHFFTLVDGRFMCGIEDTARALSTEFRLLTKSPTSVGRAGGGGGKALKKNGDAVVDDDDDKVEALMSCHGNRLKKMMTDAYGSRLAFSGDVWTLEGVSGEYVNLKALVRAAAEQSPGSIDELHRAVESPPSPPSEPLSPPPPPAPPKKRSRLEIAEVVVVENKKKTFDKKAEEKADEPDKKANAAAGDFAVVIDASKKDIDDLCAALVAEDVEAMDASVVLSMDPALDGLKTIVKRLREIQLRGRGVVGGPGAKPATREGLEAEIERLGRNIRNLETDRTDAADSEDMFRSEQNTLTRWKAALEAA